MGSNVFVLILLLLSVVLVVAAVRRKRPAQSTTRRVGTAAEIGSLTIPRNTTNSFTRAEQLRWRFARFACTVGATFE